MPSSTPPPPPGAAPERPRLAAIGELPIVLWIGLFTFGAIFAAVGVSVFLKARAAQSWPTAKAKIEESRVVATTERDSRDRPVVRYAPSVLYTYSVKERQFAGTRISHLSVSSSVEGRVRAIADEYRAGTHVLVYYNPADPAEAYLDPAAGWGALVFFLFGNLAAALGVAGFVVRLRAPRPEPEPEPPPRPPTPPRLRAARPPLKRVRKP
jgi:hypothetical protein